VLFATRSVSRKLLDREYRYHIVDTASEHTNFALVVREPHPYDSSSIQPRLIP